MTNNDILRRIRYTFNLKDAKMIDVFAQADLTVTREQVSAWLKREEDKGFKRCKDVELATFLNGLINVRRGKKEGEQPKPEKALTNNMIFMKLRIALNMKSEDILNVMELVDFDMSAHELGAFFRKPNHKNYRECKDQILRNFLTGVQRLHRPDQADFDEVEAV
ncbi:hypothetical protein BCU68_16000 [Vibrio sp. 10N.286.49.B3]|uniref:DUF1456 family protein n=1 Tax=Vibrio sp. 10N.286.49.B3 TaxID=1880855 RepID=UPI000C84E7CC|nr:DUF1456 family protein [Vibrio sp. 10N.286.49.B3]PMH40872.1 hypothetical protein BCU68_16000 [Vibrio sp. 10N.286.49.B3]